MFASQLPAESLVPWTPIVDAGHQCLEFSNRYFSRSPLDMQNLAKFDHGIDPKGILAALDVQGRYTEDNVVLYFEKVKGKTDTYVACYKNISDTK